MSVVSVAALHIYARLAPLSSIATIAPRRWGTTTTGQNMPPASAREIQFHQRMIQIYKDAKDEGYNAVRFLSMVNEHGGLQTARILLRPGPVSEGYTALWERGRLDLTVEAVVLEQEWRDLFSPEERSLAVKRLREYGYQGALPLTDGHD